MMVGLLVWLATSLFAGEETPWLHGTNTWGGQGIHRADAPLATTPGEVTVSASVSGFVDRQVFAAGDQDSGFATDLRLAWTPIFGVQLGASGAYIFNTYTTFASYTVQALGNPALHAKAGLEVAPGYALGVAAHAGLNTYAKSSLASVPVTSRYELLAAAQPLPFLQVAANLGFVYDRSQAAYATPPNPPVRLAFDINQSSHFDYAVGLLGRIRAVSLAPFVEFSGALGGATLAQPWTAVVTPGLRLDRSYGGIFEAGVAVDVRVAGAPNPSATFAGVPAWRAYLTLAVHGLTSTAAELEWRQQDCQRAADCPATYDCVQGICTPPPPLPPSPPHQAAIVLRGTVHDAVSGAPVFDAKVVLLDYPQAPLRVNSAGAFTSFPLPADANALALAVHAFGYVDAQLQVQTNAPPMLDVRLQPLPKRPGSLHVFVRDAHTNLPVTNAAVEVPALQLRALVDANGEVILPLPAGIVRVVTTAEQFAPQKVDVEVVDGATIILNIDLRPPRLRSEHRRH